MRGWVKPFASSQREEMHAEGGRHLYVKVAGGRLDYSTEAGGFIYRENGWVYGHSGGRAWAVPEAQIVGITEA